MIDKNDILILCKVVDNFGDIGVVYRLARALSDLRPSLNLTLVVSNLESFHALAPQIEPKKSLQDFRYKNSVWKIVDWNLGIGNEELGMRNEEGAVDTCEEIQNFSLLTPRFSLILECFQCGRPDWLENLLFSPDFTDEVQILQIDYLTAEDYAEEFHLLKSGTRKTNIKKRFFMPGFTEKTGGLIFNEKLAVSNEKLENSRMDAGKSKERKFCLPLGEQNFLVGLKNTRKYFSILFFAYEDDCSAVVQAISDFQEKMRETDADFSVCVYLASGKSSVPFENAWKKGNFSFKVEKIPFLPQEEFDFFILTMDFLFVRGEDSLARACLSSLPFVWQAYKQDENYQLVKVSALLERMKAFFTEEEFAPIQAFWQSYNDYENQTESEPLAKMLLDSANHKNTDGFKKFAAQLFKNGNLAVHLLEFIDSLS